MAHRHREATQTQLEGVGNVRTDFVMNSVCPRGETNMQQRVGVLFATTVLISFVLAACRTRTAPQEDDKKAAINVVLAHEQAVQTFDFNKVDSLHTPDARNIEESYPQPFEPTERRDWQPYKDAGIHIDYHPQDAVADVRGNVAWVTVTLHSTWAADTPVGRAMLGGSAWRGTLRGERHPGENAGGLENRLRLYDHASSRFWRRAGLPAGTRRDEVCQSDRARPRRQGRVQTR